MSVVNNNFGEAMKNARNTLEMTQEQLAERLGVSDRYIVQLEKGRRTPSFKLLCVIIPLLNIQPELIFYPEKPSKDSWIEDLVRMLPNCDECYKNVIQATVKAAWEDSLRK